MPEYFKSLSVIEKSKTGIVLVEKIKFLGISLKVKTKHVIKFPDVHMIYILSGPIKGTTFVEYYQNYDNGTEILIDIQLRFNGVFKLFRFLEGYVATRMSVVMDEFIVASENYAATTLNS
jgi:hypothetical protein